jgi:hypothetical protein
LCGQFERAGMRGHHRDEPAANTGWFTPGPVLTRRAGGWNRERNVAAVARFDVDRVADPAIVACKRRRRQTSECARGGIVRHPWRDDPGGVARRWRGRHRSIVARLHVCDDRAWLGPPGQHTGHRMLEHRRPPVRSLRSGCCAGCPRGRLTYTEQRSQRHSTQMQASGSSSSASASGTGAGRTSMCSCEAAPARS